MNIDFDALDNLDNSLPDLPEDETSQSAQDRLLVLQTKKVELIHQREALQARKHELADAIDRLNLTLADYQRQHKQYETREKLEYYLNQNDHEYARLAAQDNAAAFVLDNVNVLPSPDWTKRLQLVGKFMPHMEISTVSTRTLHKNDNLVTVMAYSVAAKGLPTLHVELHVQNEQVDTLHVANWDEASWLLRKVSPSFFGTLKRNYIPRGKVDLLMYGYHSLARLQHRRVTAVGEILTLFRDLVVRPAQDWEVDPFASLAALPYIELDLAPENHPFKVRLYWELVLEDVVTGSLANRLEFVVLGDNDNVVKNTNEVFLGLVPLHGVAKAFSVMLRNIFGIGRD